jgi:hypothetical protein
LETGAKTGRRIKYNGGVALSIRSARASEVRITVWENFKSMPTLLKFLTAHAFICFVFLIGSIIPHGYFSINGRPVSFSEWWSSGAGLLCSLIGIVFPVLGYLFLVRARYARGLYVAAFVALSAFGPIGSPPASYYLAALVFVIGIAIYLYIWSSVRDYFCSNQALHQPP